MPGAFGIVVVLVVLVVSGLKVVREYERVVVFRLGRLVGARGPGIIYVIPGIEKALRVDLRTVTMDIPSQDVITKDNVSVKVNAVLYFRVLEPTRAVVDVENYLFATSQNAQTTLRSVCGEVELVAIKQIDLAEEMRRAMARQAEADRERRAKIIAAEGEFQAAQRLSEAAAIMAKDPITLQLRYLQTLAAIATENNSTTIFPVPIDILRPFLAAGGRTP